MMRLAAYAPSARRTLRGAAEAPKQLMLSALEIARASSLHSGHIGRLYGVVW